ncbi:hypothetical protein BKA62DRAFT_36789 [Auriculariales sp. MPI-PUGE-AT-0066]|nr:hypothetical protein BKA62DRAFT_36789 [Auriculariales sp. MPI-PUGE-AT-0066]
MSLRRGTLGLLRAVPSTRRPYSFFSSKSGAGRIVSATKSLKVATTTNPSSPTQQTQPPQLDADASISKVEADTAPQQEPIVSPLFAMAAARSDLTLADVRLNAFFALDRPLLLLEQPSSSLFAPAAALEAVVPGPSSAPTYVFTSAPFDAPLLEDPPEATHESDADAARLLSRSLVLSRVGAWADWEHALAQIEGRSTGVALDSTRRKKRKKMKKHKLVKRRRVLRKSNILK